MSKLKLKSVLYIFVPIVVFGVAALKWFFWFNSNPYTAFFYGIILVPFWAVLFFLWLFIVVVGYRVDSRRWKIEDSIEEDFSVREEQRRKAMKKRIKCKESMKTEDKRGGL